MENNIDKRNTLLSVPLMFLCLVEQDSDTNLFVSHSLTFDLVATAKTEEESLTNLKMLIQRYMDLCIFVGPLETKLNVTADDEDWLRWVRIVKSSEQTN